MNVRFDVKHGLKLEITNFHLLFIEQKILRKEMIIKKHGSLMKMAK